MPEPNLPSERHYRFHLRRMAWGLAFSVAVGVAMVLALAKPGPRLIVVMVPAAVFIFGAVALDVALRGRRWREPDAEDRRIRSDERVRANMDRARRVALRAIYLTQLPLMPLVAYAQPNPPTVEAAVVGMALLTMASGSAAFFASYLHYSRRDAHG